MSNAASSASARVGYLQIREDKDFPSGAEVSGASGDREEMNLAQGRGLARAFRLACAADGAPEQMPAGKTLWRLVLDELGRNTKGRQM